MRYFSLLVAAIILFVGVRTLRNTRSQERLALRARIFELQNQIEFKQRMAVQLRKSLEDSHGAASIPVAASRTTVVRPANDAAGMLKRAEELEAEADAARLELRKAKNQLSLAENSPRRP